MFHLTTHAFFKALLFLAAGSVIHALHEEQDIWKMGGLWRKIPLTFVTFTIGMLALIGLPPFAGFFSKDYLLTACYHYSPIFYWMGVLTAGLTAFYMSRLVIVAFFGPARTSAAEHPHESPLNMTVPLILLAVLSVIGGWSVDGLGLKDYYQAWGAPLMHAASPAPATDVFLEMILPGTVVLFGVGLALSFYWGHDRDLLGDSILSHKFYVDEFYDRIIVPGQQTGANILNWFDSWILDGLVLRGGAYVSVGVGELLRLFQTGSLQTYAFIFSLGGIVLIYFTLFAH
jgi:NADH-quinone oxidoreductase subunit L